MARNVRGRRKCPANKDGDNNNGRQQKIPKSQVPLPPETVSRSSSQSLTSIQSRPIKGSNHPARKRSTKDKTLSKLESIPAELVEKIFLYSLNVNLARASPYLAAAVSNERVYRLLILLAFWDNDISPPHDSERYVIRKDGNVISRSLALYEDSGAHTCRKSQLFDIAHILRPLGHNFTPLTYEGRKVLQSDIVWCRWCTIDRIRRQRPDLTRLLIAWWCFNPGYVLKEDNQGRELEELLQSGETGKFLELTATRKIQRRWGVETKVQDCEVHVKTGEFVELHLRRIPYPDYELAPYDYNYVLPYDYSVDIDDDSHYVDDSRGKSLFFPLLSLTEIPSFYFNPNINTNHRGLVRGSFTDTHMTYLNTLFGPVVVPGAGQQIRKRCYLLPRRSTARNPYRSLHDPPPCP